MHSEKTFLGGKLDRWHGDPLALAMPRQHCQGLVCIMIDDKKGKDHGFPPDMTLSHLQSKDKESMDQLWEQ